MNTKSGGRSVPYDLVKEQWNEYVFSDQTVVRVRLILTQRDSRITSSGRIESPRKK